MNNYEKEDDDYSSLLLKSTIDDINNEICNKSSYLEEN